MRPVCVKCQCEMRCVKTGADIVVMSGCEPYQIWQADIFGCPSCGVEVIAGWASKPWKAQHDPDFDELVSRLQDARQSSPSCRIEYVYEKPTPKKKG